MSEPSNIEEFIALVEIYANTSVDANTPEERRFIWHEPSHNGRATELVGQYNSKNFTILFDPEMDFSPEERDELAKQAAAMSGC